ncbi:NADase-type glycan-binding domain-containing protein [Methyloceanibacter sp.]|uniref:NADase-type glycan-binding domain-containing protein n=1 Tax=Methyloceanibacter sp. TaxID=1965321 RepID=UPI003D6D0FEF
MLRLLIFALGVMLVTPALTTERVALVIGNDAYSHVPVLQKAAADARTMAASLSTLGFEVTTGINVSRTETNRKLQDFLNRIEPGDEALFYFAGHGVEIAGANYLLPIDIPEASPGNEEFLKSEAISFNAVLDGLRERKARVTIIVIDACRDNPFASKTGRSVGGARGLALVVPPQGTFIMYSAGAGEAALDRLSDADAETNSVFTRTFVPLLIQGGLNLPELARETRRRVHELAASAGRTQTPAYYDEVLGDFSFTPGSGAEAQPTLPKPTPAPVPPVSQPVAPAPAPEPKLARLPEPAPPENAPRPRKRTENCSRSGNATFCVSSALAPAHGLSYGARNLIDGNDNTAWVEGSNGQGAGDFVVIEFDTPRLVRGLTMWNGYAKNADIFGKNSRVKDVVLNFSTGDSLRATLTDGTGEQRVNLSRPVTAKWVQLTIRSVYPGWKYSDTALNELRVDAQ